MTNDEQHDTAETPRAFNISEMVATCGGSTDLPHAWAHVAPPTSAGDSARVTEAGAVITRAVIRALAERDGARVTAADLDSVTTAAAVALSEMAVSVATTAAAILVDRCAGKLPAEAIHHMDTLARLAHRNAEEQLPAVLPVALAVERAHADENRRNGEPELRAGVAIGRALIHANIQSHPDAFAAVARVILKTVAHEHLHAVLPTWMERREGTDGNA